MDTDAVSKSMQGAIETAISLLSTWGISVIGAIALLIAGRIVAGWVRGSITKGLTKANTDPSLIPFFASMAFTSSSPSS